MTRSLLYVALFALPSSIGCGDGKQSADMAAHSTKDMAADASGDMAAVTCTQLATWSTLAHAFNHSDSSGFDIGIFANESDPIAANKIDRLTYEYYSTTPPTPHTYSFNGTETFQTCTDCVTLEHDFFGADDTYIALSGTVSVTELDDTMPTGTVSISATNLRLFHWDTEQDVGFDDGECFDLAAVTLSATYGATGGDAGT